MEKSEQKNVGRGGKGMTHNLQTDDLYIDNDYEYPTEPLSNLKGCVIGMPFVIDGSRLPFNK